MSFLQYLSLHKNTFVRNRKFTASRTFRSLHTNKILRRHQKEKIHKRVAKSLPNLSHILKNLDLRSITEVIVDFQPLLNCYEKL